MIPSRTMALHILCIAGPTASGKSSRAVAEALARNGEIISVDSRQVYRGLDIGTEKVSREEMRGVPHYLIDIREPSEAYSAGDFVKDATRLIRDISAHGKLPILVGGTHFYFDALFKGIPSIAPNEPLRKKLGERSDEQLLEEIKRRDPERAKELDPRNRRRLIRALEIIEALGSVPRRTSDVPRTSDVLTYGIEWTVLDPPREELRARIDARLKDAFARGLIDEVRRVREQVGDVLLNELGLEYKIVGEYLRNERDGASLLPSLSAKLWQYARRQKAWLRKLARELPFSSPAVLPLPGRS